jgi:hypothetical protein
MAARAGLDVQLWRWTFGRSKTQDSLKIEDFRGIDRKEINFIGSLYQ